jgi:hypothetical protein
MIALLRLQLKYRWKVWLVWSILSGCMLAIFLRSSAGAGLDSPLFLLLAMLYVNNHDSYGDWQLPTTVSAVIALPIGKRSYVGYLISRKFIFYVLSGTMAAAVLAVLSLISGTAAFAPGRLTFAALAIIAFEGLGIALDGITDMRGKASILFVLAMIPTIAITPPFDAAMAKSAISGSFTRSLKSGYDWSLAACAAHPAQVLFVGLAFAALCSAIALARAKKIRF